METFSVFQYVMLKLTVPTKESFAAFYHNLSLNQKH